jgi:hypothetical protein
MQSNIATGYIRGTGAAVNVSIGFVPDMVRVMNLTDGDLWTEAYLGGGRSIMPFSSGGTNAIAALDYIKGATSGARAQVLGVILDSGSFAGGDAAGWLLLDHRNKSGTFQSENIVHCDSRGNTLNSETDNATVTVDVQANNASAAAVATATGNSAITAYYGSSSASDGFTLGSTVSEDAKLIFYIAHRCQGGPAIANSL